MVASGDDVIGASSGGVLAVALGGTPGAVAPGGAPGGVGLSASVSMLDTALALVVVEGLGLGSVGAAAAFSNHDVIATTEILSRFQCWRRRRGLLRPAA